MKKLLALLLTLTMIFSATSCGGKKKSDIKDSPAAVTISQTTYGAEEVYLDTINDLMYPTETAVYDEGVCIFYTSNDEKSKFARLDKDFNVVSTALLSEDANTSMTNYVYSDGSFDYISIETDFEFEYNETNQITNWEQYYAEADFTFYLVCCDRDGNVISTTEIVGAEEYFDPEIPGMSQLVPCGEDRMMFKFGSGLIIFDKEGNIIDADRGDQYNSVNIAAASDGRVICHQYSSYGFMSPDSASVPTDLTYVKELSGCYMPPVTGTGAFLAYFSFSDGLYGLTEGGDFIQVIDYGKSLMTNTNGIILPYDEGVFIACNGGNKLNIYRRRPDDYVENRKNIDLWMIGSGGTGMHDSANDFCLLNDDYMISIKENVPFDDLPTAILAGDGPDIVYGCDDVPELVNLGALEELTPYLDSDIGTSRDDLLPNVLEALTYKGGIYSISDSFTVNLMVAKKDILGDEYRNWSMRDFLDIYDSMPAGTMICDTKFSAHRLCYSSAWIDYDKAACNFDCDEFIRILNIIKEHEKNFPEVDYDDYDSLIVEYYGRFKRGEAMINGNLISLYDLGSLFNELGFSGMSLEDVSLLHEPGCPGEIGIPNSYYIMANSDCKDGAWEFISYILDTPDQEGVAPGFPANKKTFEKVLNSELDPPEGRRMGKTTLNDFPMTYEGSTSQEQLDRIYDFVKECRTMSYTSRDVYDIITEEYSRFEKDEITAEECARNLQERIGIMLSEAA